MSENMTRKGERTKKPPKYMQYDDADYGIFQTAKAADQKQKTVNSTQINQIARIFLRFVVNINQKLRDYNQVEHHERSSNHHDNGIELEPKEENLIQNGDHTTQKLSGMPNAGTKRGRETNDRAGVEPKAGKNQGKKANNGSRSQANMNSNIQADLDYHSMINQHIRNAYPNISNFSPEMLKGLDIPRQLLDFQNTSSKGKSKEEKGKGNQMLKNMRAGKDKEELKPFKRQSYHVAIAYHIHLKRIKNINPTAQEIDPTYPARKLREIQAANVEKQQ